MAHEATVRTVGVSESEGVPVVVLAAREEVVPILVSPDQAHSIRLALQAESFERPLTHDLIVEMAAEFGGAIDRVRIDELRDGTFLAKLDAEQYHGGERRTAVFDVRASDGIAVALRVDCPIEVSDAVLDDAGRPPDRIDIRQFEEFD
ncbi:MAG: bifunctional nuclease family protein [Halobacteriaceae archaeon]